MIGTIAAIVALAISICFKEPTFIFYATFIGFSLLFGMVLGQRISGRIAVLHVLASIAIACYLAAYLYYIPIFGVFEQASAYGQAKFSLSSIPYVLGQYLAAEPIFAILLIGLGLIAIDLMRRWRSERKLVKTYMVQVSPLVFGGLAYLLFYCAIGLTSRYYGALPQACFIIAVIAYLLLFVGRKATLGLSAALIITNLVLAVPAMIYKHDWTERNHEIAQIMKINAERTFEVQGPSWTVFMFVIALRGIERVTADLDCAGMNGPKDLDGGTICQADGKPGTAEFLIDLPFDVSHASIRKSDTVLWEYESMWRKWVPAPLQDLLASQYRIW